MLLSVYRLHHFTYHRHHTEMKRIDFVRPCIGYVLSGQAEFLYKGKNYLAEKGDLVYIAADTLYYSAWTGNPLVSWYSIDFAFSQKDAFYEYPFQILKGYPPEAFQEIFKEGPKVTFQSLSAFYRLLEDLYQRMKREPRDPRGMIDPAIHYIEAHFTKEISCKMLADLCHCSESSLFKQFKRIKRISPIQYKQNLQIQAALELLSHTALSIEEISARVGFSSANYFRTVFQKFIGKSPKEIRKAALRG